MAKQILLVGAGLFGRYVAMELNELGHEVMAVDMDEARMDEILPYVTNGQIGDGTNEEFLRSLGIPDFDVCIVAIAGSFQASLECTYLLKELGAKMVVSRAERDGQAKFLLRNGADEVVYPEKQLAIWTAIRFSSNHIRDYIPLDEENAIFEVNLPDHWAGKTAVQIDARRKFGINILGVKENGRLDLKLNPDKPFEAGSVIMVMGSYEELQKCFHIQ